MRLTFFFLLCYTLSEASPRASQPLSSFISFFALFSLASAHSSNLSWRYIFRGCNGAVRIRIFHTHTHTHHVVVVIVYLYTYLPSRRRNNILYMENFLFFYYSFTRTYAYFLWNKNVNFFSPLFGFARSAPACERQRKNLYTHNKKKTVRLRKQFHALSIIFSFFRGCCLADQYVKHHIRDDTFHCSSPLCMAAVATTTTVREVYILLNFLYYFRNAKIFFVQSMISEILFNHHSATQTLTSNSRVVVKLFQFNLISIKNSIIYAQFRIVDRRRRENKTISLSNNFLRFFFSDIILIRMVISFTRNFLSSAIFTYNTHALYAHFPEKKINRSTHMCATYTTCAYSRLNSTIFHP